jgi:isobutyryl-CoA mutase
VLKEFDAIADRGGVLGAMETGYQRGKIQEESLYYERRKHDGSYPIIGVNTFRNPSSQAAPESIELARSTDAEKQSQLERLKRFQHAHAPQAPELLERLRRTVIDNGNTFEVLMDAVRGCSLGQITHTLYDVGGRYRRNM